ncbi:MAG TPA: hypothetical protein VF406_16180 [Thermodesulfobacteriota bacterium]
MAHQRAAIRAAVMAALNGKTTAEGRVYEHALDPLPSEARPALVVRTGDETAEPLAMGRDLRTIPLAIEAHARGKTPAALEAALDALAEEVETAMDALGPTFDGLVLGVQYQGTSITRSAEGEQGADGVATLGYEVQYEARAFGVPA